MEKVWKPMDNLRGENWRKAKIGIDGYYINEYGDMVTTRIKNKKYYVLKRQKYKVGYEYYSISSGIRKKCIKIKIHRAVGLTFLPNPNNLPVINHKDGDKTNNYVGNLEWCSISENVLHGIYVLHKRNGGRKRIKVKCKETGEIFESMSDAARSKDVFRSGIKKVLDGKQNSTKGFTWERII